MAKRKARAAACGLFGETRRGGGRFLWRQWFLSLSVVILGSGAAANAAAVRCTTPDCLARVLVRHIPPRETIALVPFGPPRTSVPDREAKILHDSIHTALFSNSEKLNRKHEYMSPELREDIWQYFQTEREESDYQAFWKTRTASVIIDCKPREPRPSGLRLHCIASSVGEKSRLKGSIIGPQTVLPVQERFFHYKYELTRLGRKLSGKKIKLGKILPKDLIFDSDLGQQTKLSRDVGKKLRAIIEERFRARQSSIPKRIGMNAVQGRGDKAAAQRGHAYELRGYITWGLDKALTISARFVDSETRDTLSKANITIDHSWLPKHLLKGRFSHYATAHAVMSKQLDAQTAKLAVKNLARAMVVEDALGIPGPGIETIRTEAQGIRVLRDALEHGVPSEERFVGPTTDGRGGWTTELGARVVKLDAASKPVFTAKLAKNELRAREKIRIELSTKAKKTVHVAAFAWGADGKVVRLYPHAGLKNPVIPANGRLSLPLGEKDCVFWSAPVKGKNASHEAVIVVAAYGRLPFNKLAPPLCFKLSEKPNPPIISADAFLKALAGLKGIRKAAIAVLPYRVRR